MSSLPEPILYNIKPTKLVPNSPKPLLLYKKAFVKDGKVDRTAAFETFRSNNWDVQWLVRYGQHQRAHYHSQTHEAMIVVHGPGKIRWGVADLSDNWEDHTYGQAYEDGGIEVEVEVGDLFVIPAGVSHKSYDPDATSASFGCLTGDARKIDSNIEVAEVPLEGFYDEEEEETLEDYLIELLTGASDDELDFCEDEDIIFYEKSVDEAAHIVMDVGRIPLSQIAPPLAQHDYEEPKDLHHKMFPETFDFRLETIRDTAFMIPIMPDEAAELRNDGGPDPNLDADFQPDPKMPRYSTKDIMVEKEYKYGL
ncbi:hypothetical protein NW768_002497 [Fusarium equiseti]|uniref:Cupin type-1 domain-containing protein n=1 Tax=Fusarium equiseti TaxID=61235 RepID=A0ABQ8RNW0_FUSEQ|nr:hypothetical protein NW768_002497 [Fusarium equiseti]